MQQTIASTAVSFAPTPRPEVLALQPSRIREIANAAMGRPDVLPFWFGESDRPTPEFIRKAAMTALEAGHTFYTQNLGRPALRSAIAAYLSKLHGAAIAPERVAVTGSGVSALMLAAQMVLSPGDRAVVVTPIWPNIAEIPTVIGAEVVRVPLRIANGRWDLDLDRLIDALTPDTKLVFISSPNNPTGWTIEPEALNALLDHCRKHGIWLVTDDVYERLVYRPGMASAPSLLGTTRAEERLISVNSFSKAWSMTGWRAGWMVGPEPFIAELAKIIEYNTSCVPDFVQQGAVAALDPIEGEAVVADLLARLGASRNRLVSGLKALPGVEVPEADGAMYAFFRIKGHEDSMQLALDLVRDVGLGLAPGSAFGAEGEGWLRWCFAAAPDRIDQGLERIGQYLAKGR